ncbi:helix-turn-helix domain-containing protein [Fulvivirgaceae bacterium PWU4]|uniref:Helix-turn-helix domain-containing protein n=1 Tax=Chryseosolibacter histidini TaxID=2782349 RepID=A0AAP2GHH4_9BACT|nr:helix-turn-helix transcriptional regulator [Chryseosolibacter histidini]MBT1696069.1 helix-turn-helix domain-containing protein [Chryseosolibacter histidini]
MNIGIAPDQGFEKFMQNVGSGLRHVREAQKRDIHTVAEAVAIPHEQLDLIEQGKFNWEVQLIARLCNYYEVTVKEVMSHGKTTL